MQKVKRLSPAVLIGILSVLAGGRPILAAVCPGPHGSTIDCGPLQYHGGPFLEKFEIHPLYYGQWTKSQIDTQQAYLVNLAAYMSGTNAPAFQQPMMKQYGVEQVTVAAAQTANPDAKVHALSRDEIVNIIGNNQTSGRLPGWGPHKLIVVFPGKDFTLVGCDGCGYHSSQSIEAFWAVVPQYAAQVVIAHEIFEASADPADDTFNGWDEAVDQCDNAPNITLSSFGGMQIPPATDNTNGGACSKTGYTSLGELQDYEVDHNQFLNDYNSFLSQGWRLYILQSFVLANGDVRYNAVWRPGNEKEQLLLGGTSTQFWNNDLTLYRQGWNLYILQAYVLPGGEVLYNAVWRRADYYGNGKVAGDIEEQPALDVTKSQFISDYNAVYAQPSHEQQPGWRLTILQTYLTAAGELLYNAVWRPGDASVAVNEQMTSAQLDSDWNTLYPLGWRLYILQSYVVPGQVNHNMVWRQGAYDEKAVFGWTYTDYRAKYDELYPNGWRLYVLNAYVLPGGGVRYDAVWRLGTIDRPL
jgi:hypothetical protein